MELSVGGFTLYRIFKRECGMSLSKYLLFYRIEQAREMLCHTNLSVKNIAYSVGFRDQLYFSRFFSKINGLSPLAYRKQYK